MAIYKKTAAKKWEQNSWKKIWHLIKTTVAKTNWTKQRRIKKCALYKNDMTVAKKIGAKQLKIKNGTL